MDDAATQGQSAETQAERPTDARKRARDLRNAWLFWFAVVIGVCAIGLATGFERNTTDDQAWAVQRWFDGVNLYATERLGYYYPPQSALIFAPFALLPAMLGALLWRIVSVGAYAAAMSRMSRRLCPEPEFFGIASLVAIPPMLDAARNGQATVCMTAGMLACAAFLAGRRWWLATVAILFAVALKPLAIVMLMLVAALYARQLWWRLAIAVPIVAALPFLFQSPDYVLEQYQSLLAKYTSSYVPGGSREADFGTHAELFSMLHVFGVEVPHILRTILRLAFALAALGLGWRARRRFTPAAAAALIFALAATYLMLFNPINENNTFAILAPALGLAAAHAFVVEKRPIPGFALVAISLLITANFELTKFITPENPIWLAPLVTIPFGAALGLRIMRGPRPAAEPAPEGASA